MKRLFLAIFDYLQPRKKLFFAASALLLAGLGFIATNLEFEEDITKMMPLDLNLKRMSEVLEDSGIADRTVITLSGNSGVGPLKTAADSLASRLEKNHADLIS